HRRAGARHRNARVDGHGAGGTGAVHGSRDVAERCDRGGGEERPDRNRAANRRQSPPVRIAPPVSRALAVRRTHRVPADRQSTGDTISEPMTTVTPGGHSIRLVALASLIGTSIEWYDFFLYNTAAALVFNKLFFPTFDPFVGTLLAFSTYAVGFAARPIGGIVIGHYGDKVGRKSMLVLTLI